MTQAPGSCDKPPACDNNQRQTNPETFPGLAGLQAARPRRGEAPGGTRQLPPAQLLPRHLAGHSRMATATLVPPGSGSARGCWWQGPAPQPLQHLSSPLRYHGRVPAGRAQPNSSHQCPTAQLLSRPAPPPAQPPQGTLGWGSGHQPQFPKQEKGLGWLGCATATPHHVAPRLRGG